jgi:hypothetical protein
MMSDDFGMMNGEKRITHGSGRRGLDYPQINADRSTQAGGAGRGGLYGRSEGGIRGGGLVGTQDGKPRNDATEGDRGFKWPSRQKAGGGPEILSPGGYFDYTSSMKELD